MLYTILDVQILEFKILLYYVPFLPVNLTLFPPTGFIWSTQGRRGRYNRTNIGGNKEKTQWSAQRNKNGSTMKAYQEENGSTEPAPET